MQMKIPKNNTATSMIAAKLKSFIFRVWPEPNPSDAAVIASSTTSRKYSHGCQSVPGNDLLGSKNATANTIASNKLFPLQQDLENYFLALPRQFGSARSKPLDCLLFVVDLERRQNGVRRNEIGKRHGHDQ